MHPHRTLLKGTHISAFRWTAAHCWALLLVRIYECLPLIGPRCGEAMRIFAFIQEPPVIEPILRHIGEPTEAPQVLPARAPQKWTELRRGETIDRARRVEASRKKGWMFLLVPIGRILLHVGEPVER